MNEFINFYKIVGLDAKTAEHTFAILDIEYQGKLTQEQFVTAGIDFFNSDDESSPSKFLWGPLLETKPAEGKPQVQWGDFWHKKLNTWSHVVDYDHQGKIELRTTV